MIKFKKIRWKNFLSTGDHWTEINFLEKNTNLIIGHNGSGKSTLSNIIITEESKFWKFISSKKYLDVNKDKLQCIVSNNLVKNSTKFGMTQSPSLLDFADDLNTVDFLLKVNE